MGKRIEKAFGRDKDKGQAPTPEDDDPNKPPEPYVCTGNFPNDFKELCQRNNMPEDYIPRVVMRPRRPVSPTPPPAADEKPKAGKKDDKKNQPPPEPEPEPVLDEHGEPPPKTYTTKDKFEYFRPCIQVEMDVQDKFETITEIYIRGWKIDGAMMDIFKQCWVKLERLHTISLWNTGLTDATLETLASFISDCPNVRNLILDNNATIRGEEYDKLLLPEESPLQNLSLRYNGITDKGAELLGKALGSTQKCNMKLISLNLNGNKITDKGAEHLASGLRMNRTLLAVSLSNNQIGDVGAKKFAEVLSRFTLTHEEIVERRRLLWEKGSPDRGKSPLPGSRRGDSRDRPGSVRSTHAKNKGDKSATKTKKDAKGGKEEEKTKGKKEPEKGGKGKDSRGSRASVVADAGKTAGKKAGDKKKPKANDKPELEPSESPELLNPLLDNVEHLDNGVVLLTGNKTLISLNLSYNWIGIDGVKELALAVGYQSSMAQFSSSKTTGTGLMRLCLNRNKVPSDDDQLLKLQALMATRDPFYKPPITSPDQESSHS